MSSETAVAPIRFFGKFRAVVVDNNDPEAIMRCRLFVPEIYGDREVSGWAWPVLAGGGFEDAGFSSPPRVGARVWVEFEGGDPDKPIWNGYWSAKVTTLNELPITATGLRDNTTQKGDTAATTSDGLEITEPRSPNTADYVNNRIMKTPGGHSQIWSDTPNNEYIETNHRSGSYQRFSVDGSIIQKARGGLTQISTKRVLHSSGDETKVIDQNKDTTIKVDNIVNIGAKEIYTTVGKQTIDIGGKRFITVGGEQTTDAKGSIINKAGRNLDNSAAGSASLTAGGPINISTGEAVTESVGNLGFSLVAYKTGILIGGRKLETLLGNITHNTLLGNVQYTTLIGFADLGTLIGRVTATNLIGPAELSTLIGNNTCTTLIGNSTCSTLIGFGSYGTLIGFTYIKGIVTFIGPAGFAPFNAHKALIAGLIFNYHIHNAPFGPTSPPLGLLQGIPGFDACFSVLLGF